MRALGEDGLKRVLTTTAKRAGIKKKIFPHLFRHSRATHLAKDLTEQEMKIFFGWTPRSNMTSVYVHLSGQDVEDKLLAIKGLKEEHNKKKEVLKVMICPFCSVKNSGTNKFCSNCSRPLRDEDKINLIKAKDKAMDISIKKGVPISKDLIKEVLKEMIKDGEFKF